MPHQILSAPPRLGLVSAALNPPCSVTLHGCPWLPKPMCTRRFRVVCMGCTTCVDRLQPMQTRC